MPWAPPPAAGAALPPPRHSRTCRWRRRGRRCLRACRRPTRCSRLSHRSRRSPICRHRPPRRRPHRQHCPHRLRRPHRPRLRPLRRHGARGTLQSAASTATCGEALCCRSCCCSSSRSTSAPGSRTAARSNRMPLTMAALRVSAAGEHHLARTDHLRPLGRCGGRRQGGAAVGGGRDLLRQRGTAAATPNACPPRHP
jgi:hypothetical protein